MSKKKRNKTVNDIKTKLITSTFANLNLNGHVDKIEVDID